MRGPQKGVKKKGSRGLKYEQNTTTNFELIELQKNDKGFQGVFSRDEAPRLKPSNSLILNLDPGLSGTHWVGLKKTPSKLLYFDSFGTPPPQSVVNMYGKDNIMYNSKQIQGIKSTSCGYFTVLFLKSVGNIKQYNKFVNTFCCDVMVNEKIIQEFIDNI